MIHAEPVSVSGIYPGLAYFNNEGECGTGAVVPWADRLWVITYAPHAPTGSSDKLYEITPDLKSITHPESIGGTPANRMIHKESNQLFIGPYAIDAQRNVRVIPVKAMYGRMTGNARHLTDPANKIYYATMEEGIYEVDVHSLAVTELWRDEQKKDGRHSDLPGYHGKGLYSGQGRLIYANNGDHAAEATTNPAAPSGVLAEWDGKADKWTVIRRNQFTDVTGPGGITGNPSAGTDPVWTIGWDYRSLIFMCLNHGKWTAYRLPKGSHSYDGAHGWNTEWPRIRDIGQKDYLMTMHGTFWKFPATFDSTHSAGITPLSNYLKVIGDFSRWKDKVVFGCDDTAKAEFLNKNKAKGEIAAPQSQSNLWFVDPGKLADFGPVIGRGAVWQSEAVKRNVPSDPYLFSGYEKKGLHLSADVGRSGLVPVVTVEVDAKGDGQWKTLTKIKVDKPAQWIDLSAMEGAWIRLTSDSDLTKATAFFQYSNKDTRGDLADEMFSGLAKASETNLTGGVIRARAKNARTLALAASSPQGDIGYYELDGDLKLKRVDDPALLEDTKKETAIPSGAVSVDAASVVYVDEKGSRWRLPKGDPSFDQVGPLGEARVCREVSTERNLFNAGGIFYEQPANNAGGFAKARAVATHNLRIQDYCSYRGMFVMTGVANGQGADNPHIIRSDDGKAALWAGAIDDVWKLGKPRGKGGPWKETTVKAGVPSDPYLLTGFDQKTLVITTKSPATVRAQIDLTGSGEWVDYATFKVDGTFQHQFPDAFQAYWIRFTSDTDNVATAQLDYR
ncbi:hypothetical protein llg_39780 [Luteolibacter sp. LG18]|nr:hypothetical protein llg_39780 [Luteolibacter sp. LG18]